MYYKTGAIACVALSVAFSGCGGSEDSPPSNDVVPVPPGSTTPRPTYAPCEVHGTNPLNRAELSQFISSATWELADVLQCAAEKPSVVASYQFNAGSDSQGDCEDIENDAEVQLLSDCVCGDGSEVSCMGLPGWQGPRECELWLSNKDIKVKSIRQATGLYRIYNFNCGNGKYTTDLKADMSSKQQPIYKGLKSLAGVPIPAQAQCPGNENFVDAAFKRAIEDACSEATKKLLCQYEAVGVNRTDSASLIKRNLTSPYNIQSISCGNDGVPSLAVEGPAPLGSEFVFPGDECNTAMNDSLPLTSLNALCTELLPYRCPVEGDLGSAIFWTNEKGRSYPSPVFACDDGRAPIVNLKDQDVIGEYIAEGVTFEPIPDCTNSSVTSFQGIIDKICAPLTTPPPSNATSSFFSLASSAQEDVPTASVIASTFSPDRSEQFSSVASSTLPSLI